MKIVIVSSICVRHDAISDSVRGMQRAIADAYRFEPPIFCYACEYPSINHRIVKSTAELLFNAEFMNADLIIYHFGIYYDLFDTIHADVRGKKVVYYHNVTPGAFLPATQQAVIARSNRQKASLSVADEVWAASHFNREDLINLGLDGSNITVEPLFVKFERPIERRRTRRMGSVRVLFVGRFVKSKGVSDLIDAIRLVNNQNISPIRLTLAGNIKFSDQSYIDSLETRIDQLGVADLVHWERGISDARLEELYADADIFVLPSYHEGFCVPLIEALHARCVPLTYDAGNLPHLVSTWGLTTPTGDSAALAAALADLVRQFARGRPDRLWLSGQQIAWHDYDRGVGRYLENFSYEAFARRIVSAVERVLPPG